MHFEIELADDNLKKYNDKELYLWKGNIYYDKEEYDKAIEYYTSAINIDSRYYLAFYNRGYAYIAKAKYEKAFKDFENTIEINPKFANAYVSIASLQKLKGYNPEVIIENYNKAIANKKRYANAFYNRGLAKRENGYLKESKKDFEKYIKLSEDKDDIWKKYAQNYISELNLRIKKPNIEKIKNIIDQIKEILLVKEEPITHYTSVSVLKSLILDNGKFRNCFEFIY